MEFDDDDPPDLVEVEGADGPFKTIEAEVNDLQVAKVPITIITGRLTRIWCHMPRCSAIHEPQAKGAHQDISGLVRPRL